MAEEIKPRVVEIEDKKDYQRLLVPGKDAYNLKSGCVTLSPGETVGEHSTGAREEAIVILRGKAEILCHGERINARENSIVYIPPEMKHDVKNTGQYILRYVFIVAPV